MSRLLEAQPHAADAGGVGLSANAFADVYAEHMPEITRYCRSILRDRDDAEDAAQSAMERALKALATGPAPKRMRPWLFTIAQHEAIDVLRLRRRVAPGEIDERALAPQRTPDELSAVRERLAELLADMRELTPRQREVLVARELGGNSYRSIARSLGTTEAAAQQLVLEARRSLRQFEAGRSLECDEVQGWISAHDHARVRTRRVSAHLRSCQCCRGFQHGIGARRRDFALLLPGLAGGGGWLSSLVAALGNGGVKAATTAGAVAITGATLAVTVPLQAEHPAPALPQLGARGPQATATPMPRLQAALPHVEAGATGPASRARARQVSGPPRPRARARPRSAAAGPAAGATVAPVPGRSGEPGEDAPARRPTATATPQPPPPSPAPADPAPSPRGTSDHAAELLPAAKPVLDAAEPVTDLIDDTVKDVTGALPPLPKLP